jgi:hypothetical protein
MIKMASSSVDVAVIQAPQVLARLRLGDVQHPHPVTALLEGFHQAILASRGPRSAVVRGGGVGSGGYVLPAGQGETETEGPGLMAGDIGYQRRGMPNLEIVRYLG